MTTAFPFDVDSSSDIPLWVQLRTRLVYLINSGHYRPGDQLPTVRGLASELSINYNTVNKAYLSMINDGYITSTRGRGVFVCDHDEGDAGNESTLAADALLGDCMESCRELGLTTKELQRLLQRQLRSLEAHRDGVTHEGTNSQDAPKLRLIKNKRVRRGA
ncbi:MAG: GntR family transcriptional regulator [Coriobacteriales bacterium]|jgi:GntR family transcriptional regulator|nr:GntR family transcriptional regulator [Coriobacteriales bacterium]